MPPPRRPDQTADIRQFHVPTGRRHGRQCAAETTQPTRRTTPAQEADVGNDRPGWNGHGRQRPPSQRPTASPSAIEGRPRVRSKATAGRREITHPTRRTTPPRWTTATPPTRPSTRASRPTPAPRAATPPAAMTVTTGADALTTTRLVTAGDATASVTQDQVADLPIHLPGWNGDGRQHPAERQRAVDGAPSKPDKAEPRRWMPTAWSVVIRSTSSSPTRRPIHAAVSSGNATTQAANQSQDANATAEGGDGSGGNHHGCGCPDDHNGDGRHHKGDGKHHKDGKDGKGGGKQAAAARVPGRGRADTTPVGQPAGQRRPPPHPCQCGARVAESAENGDRPGKPARSVTADASIAWVVEATRSRR